MTGITFYTHPKSRGRMVRWMLHETGAEYEPVYIDFADTDQMEDYARVNPMRKVPAIRSGDTVVTECAAICAWLADTFPDARLAPPADSRADYYRWLFFAAGPLESAIINQALGVELKPEQQGFVGYGNLQRVLDTLELAVSRKPYIAGEAFTAADVYVGAQLNFGLQFGTIEKRAAFSDYARRVTDRDAFREAAALDDAILERPGQ